MTIPKAPPVPAAPAIPAALAEIAAAQQVAAAQQAVPAIPTEPSIPEAEQPETGEQPKLGAATYVAGNVLTVGQHVQHGEHIFEVILPAAIVGKDIEVPGRATLVSGRSQQPVLQLWPSRNYSVVLCGTVKLEPPLSTVVKGATSTGSMIDRDDNRPINS